MHKKVISTAIAPCEACVRVDCGVHVNNVKYKSSFNFVYMHGAWYMHVLNRTERTAVWCGMVRCDRHRRTMWHPIPGSTMGTQY